MPTEFHYLFRKERGPRRGGDDAVEDRYSRKDIAARLVVRDELTNHFLVFESRREFLAWQEGVPEKERCFHEVVFGWLPQRLKFDIDAPADKIDKVPDALCAGPPTLSVADLREICGEDSEDSTDAYLNDILSDGVAATAPAAPTRAEKMRVVVDAIIEAVLDELHVAYFAIEDLCPTRADIAVADSSGATAAGWKFSYHLVVLPYAVADNEEAKEFTARVAERLPAPFRVFLDMNVNKSTQNFRLAGSAKPGTGRVKRVTSMFGTAEGVTDLFIQAPPGGRVLARVYTTDGAPGPKRPSLQASDPVVRAALDLAKTVTAGHTFSEVRGTLLCFTRDRPTHCRLCCETHSRDNSLMLSLNGAADLWATAAGPVTVVVAEHCRQRRGKSAPVGEFVTDAAEMRAAAVAVIKKKTKSTKPPKGLKESIAARVTAIHEKRVDPHVATEFERLPEAQKTVYAENAMRDYELTPTLAVAAQMKLGKTKALRKYLDANFPADALETKVVRFVTFRQTFSRALQGAFPDFTLYTDVTGDLDAVRHPRLIVQVESLHRVRMLNHAEPVDLLVLDEVESILAQFNSGLHRHFNAAFALFKWMLRTARHVVCMDANLSDRTFRTLQRMRPAHPTHFHWNRYARAADDVYFFTADQGAWLERLHATLRAGKRVVLPTNSLIEAKAYEEGLRREFPALKVGLYSSETAPSEKAAHFGDVHKYWGALDVLIYTPTCSAGVSFEIEHFDCLFGYFCDESCDVETCRQMLGRVRRLRTLEHYICLRATGAALPTTVDDICRLVYDKRAGLYRSVDDAALQYEYGDDGTLQYHSSDYFHLWLETVRIENLSRNDFARLFIDQVADTGARVEVLDATAGDGAAVLSSHREARAELKVAHSEAVAAAADLAPEEAEAVRESMRAQQDVAPALVLALEKYRLRDAYDWHGRPMDGGFVAAYSPGAVRRVYVNLCKIAERASLLESLRAIQESEGRHYSYIMETRTDAFGHVNESRDLLRDKTTYVYQSHFLAVWVLRVCGFRCVTDRGRVHESALEARLRSAMPTMKKAADRIVYEFGINLKAGALDRLARESDATKFLSGALRTVNAVLRAQYGLQVHRVPKRAGGHAYALENSSTGRLFPFSLEPEPDDDQPRPHIPSHLTTTAEDRRIDLFLEETYYRSASSTISSSSSSTSSSSSSTAPPPVMVQKVPAHLVMHLDTFLAEEFDRVVSHGAALA